ncbi:MAG: AraC family transcriptional regulator [Planctomycetes bacterium]|nr:AraC family transcriptional regulator [Planctomycetota bacterium]
MIYREHRPAASLERFVECVWFLRDDGGARRASERVYPDGCVEIIVQLGDRFRRAMLDGRWEIQPSSFLVGEMTRPLEIAPDGRVATMGIRFRPGGARAILGIDARMEELTDRSAALHALFGREGSRLEDALRCATGDAARVRIAEEFLARRLSRAPRADVAVDAAVREILRTRGRASLVELTAHVGRSRRHLERQFLERVGLPPKTLSRVVRFQNVFRTVRSAKATSWAAVADECGYFDQAHLIHDFRAFTGETPAAHFARDAGLAEHFTSLDRLDALLGRGTEAR